MRKSRTGRNNRRQSEKIIDADQQRNADGRRRVLRPVDSSEPPVRSGVVAPLLAELMAKYSASGLPPAYLPKTLSNPDDPEDDDS